MNYVPSLAWAAAPPTLRVAHVTPTYFAEASVIGGGERYVALLARAVSSAMPGMGFALEQAIFAIGDRDLAFIDGGVPVTVFRDDNPAAVPMAGMSARLWGALANFDVVHVHQALTLFGCYAMVVARSLNRILVVTDHGGGDCDLLLRHGGIRLADAVLAQSAFARSLLRPCFGGPMAVISGPVDTGFFTPGGAVPRRREVLSVGRLLPHKGLDRIIDALPPGLPLRLVGRAYDADYLRLLRARATGKDVTFVLDAEDTTLADCYRSAGLYVHASCFIDIHGRRVDKPELMGMAPQEALASGLPVALADTAALPELAVDDRFARVFGDIDELRAILQDFAVGAWPGAGAGELARRHAQATYGFAVVGRQLAAFYAALRSERALAKQAGAQQAGAQQLGAQQTGAQVGAEPLDAGVFA